MAYFVPDGGATRAGKGFSPRELNQKLDMRLHGARWISIGVGGHVVHFVFYTKFCSELQYGQRLNLVFQILYQFVYMQHSKSQSPYSSEIIATDAEDSSSTCHS